MTEETTPVPLAQSDLRMLLATIEYRLEIDASMSADDRNDLDALFQHLERYAEV